MANLLNDLRIALRQLPRRPVFTATAVLTLAIGMGVNTVAFTVVNALLFKGSATSGHPDVGRLATTPGGDDGGYGSLPDFQRFADATRRSLELAAEGRSSLAWRHDGSSDTAWVLFVSPNYFSMMDAPAIAGRLVVARADGGAPAVVIGERFWRDKLGAPSLAGLTIRLNDTTVSVAGVISGKFTGPAGLYSPDVWLPLDDVALFGMPAQLQARDTRWLFFLGRLAAGSSAAEVQGQLDTAAAAMARDWPDSHRERGARFQMLSEGNSERRAVAAGAAIGMGLIGLVLLLACFNVANLLLARALERERDMGIRTALGARPARLLRLVITEGFVIASLAGALALLLAWWTESLVGSFAIPIEVPQHLDFTPDLAVVAFIAAIVIVAGVLPGLWPAISAARLDVLRVLGSQGGTSASGRPSPLRRWLVGAQIAGSTAFLALAVLFIQSFSHLANAPMGFASEHLVVAEFHPASNGYTADASRRYVDALLDRVRALPGVTGAAVADRAPFFIGFDRETPVWPDGGVCEPATCPKVATLAAGPGWFATMGIPLIAGREFTPADTATSVIVNGAFARQQWPDGRGVDETLRIQDRGTTVTVVGVTARHQTRDLDQERPTLYFPVGSDDYAGALTVVARTAAAPAPVVRAVTTAAHEVDPNISLLSARTMAQRMAVQLWPFRTVSWLFSICGALALILGTVGLASVIVHAVNQRRREFGVRVSVGATPRDLIADVLTSAGRLLVPGLVVGVLLAAGLAQLAQAVLVGVNVLNPLSYLVVIVVQCAIVTLACLAPALRAARVDPLVALRAE
ncbi:MAG: ADOP family duplicated permease [Acidobacteriota bacterium]|nr:ADOP family duplicated permease [Acidobacteriota bacterium]